MAEKFFKEERFWRFLSNFWTILVYVFLIANAYFVNEFEYLMGPVLASYVGVLTIYAGTKEFDRWNDFHSGRHPGEMYVVFWTLLLTILITLNMYNGHSYKLNSEIVATYIAVLGIFALTQKSKELFRHKGGLRIP